MMTTQSTHYVQTHADIDNPQFEIKAYADWGLYHIAPDCIHLEFRSKHGIYVKRIGLDEDLNRIYLKKFKDDYDDDPNGDNTEDPDGYSDCEYEDININDMIEDKRPYVGNQKVIRLDGPFDSDDPIIIDPKDGTKRIIKCLKKDINKYKHILNDFKKHAIDFNKHADENQMGINDINCNYKCDWTYNNHHYVLTFINEMTYLILCNGKLVATLHAPNYDLSEGDGGTYVYLCNGKHIIIQNSGDVSSLVIFKYIFKS